MHVVWLFLNTAPAKDKNEANNQMNNSKDDDFIFSLHTAYQAAQQSGFRNTKRALLALLAREVGYTDAEATKRQ